MSPVGAFSSLAVVASLASCGHSTGHSADAGTSPPAPPSLEGRFVGKATVFEGFDPGFAAFAEPPASVARRDIPTTIDLGNVRPGNGSNVRIARLELRADETASWVMDAIVLSFAGHPALRLQATRPLRCGTVETGGRIAGELDGDELRLTELTSEQPCTLAGATTRLLEFRGTRVPSP